MLVIHTPEGEFWDEEQQKFVTVRSQELQLEHSLISVSKWESVWEKAFLGKSQKTDQETLDYIRHMTVNKVSDPLCYTLLTTDQLSEIGSYIAKPMSATKFFDTQQSAPSRETVTAELIYYWMIALNIPMECQKWHLNRLLSLIRVCNMKNNPGKKMSTKDVLAKNRALNSARKQQLNTPG